MPLSLLVCSLNTPLLWQCGNCNLSSFQHLDLSMPLSSRLHCSSHLADVLSMRSCTHEPLSVLSDKLNKWTFQAWYSEACFPALEHDIIVLLWPLSWEFPKPFLTGDSRTGRNVLNVSSHQGYCNRRSMTFLLLLGFFNASKHNYNPFGWCFH